jgi:protein SCO1/2
MRCVRLILWAIIALTLLALAFISLRPQQNQQQIERQAPEMSLTRFGGPFTLTGSDGKPFSSAKLNGKPYALFFGFTRCPDVCPTTLARLVRLRKQLGSGDQSFQIVFVTVDPERDTAEEVGKYTGLFNSPVIGLTGSPAQIEQVKKAFGIFSQKVPEAGGDYTVNHTSTVLLFDRSGQFAGTIATDETDPPALQKLKRITA